MKKNNVVFVVVCFFLVINAFAQEKSAKNRLPSKDVFDKVYPACIKMYGVDSVTRKQNSAPFSGVVVSADGSILTAAHATKPGNLYKVLFPDGKEGFAKALGRLVVDSKTNLPDVAVMKMEGEGLWPFAQMGWSSSLQENQLCFGWSYPETLLLNTPFLRVGRITDDLDPYGFVVSTCIMEPGDSGGPLFDALGRVVALHSRIDRAEGKSFEVPVDIYRKYWTVLQMPLDIEVYPKDADEIREDPLLELLHNQRTVVSSSISEKKAFPVVSINSLVKSETSSILGTVFVLSEKRQVIVTKSSVVGKDPVLKIENKTYPLKVLFRDKKHDLVALETSKKLKSGFKVTAIALDSIAVDDIGINIWSLLNDQRMKTGTLGMVSQIIPAWTSSGSLGTRMQEIDGLPTLTKVDSAGAAYIAGLKDGDKMIRVNDHDVSSAEKINKEMLNYFAGDTIQLTYRRGEKDFRTDVVLDAKVLRESSHPANHIPGGKSLRKDGFSNVFLHDSRVHSYECGSPVVDVEGRFLGLNIARYSHTACFAIPRDVILDFLEVVKSL
ncbi:trypsin-like peptidase domain-containing protein [Sphingobacterium sp. LRF_L2]|uniref:trypsin-like peptidase domain-containing protein n=1 Tax=Sphingobacterium sp. LRF_L2 TaxID=3369421 RepID=UPI003F625C5F